MSLFNQDILSRKRQTRSDSSTAEELREGLAREEDEDICITIFNSGKLG
jgi:hypothetical protein